MALENRPYFAGELDRNELRGLWEEARRETDEMLRNDTGYIEYQRLVEKHKVDWRTHPEIIDS